MDTIHFVEAARNSKLPFVYCDENLNDEKCQKALKKIGADGIVLGAILGNPLLHEGLAITEKGIWFAFASGVTNIVIRKAKGVFLFDDFLLHNVSVKKKLLGDFDIELTLWDVKKRKSLTFEFELVVDNSISGSYSPEDVTDILMTLSSKTGTEYVSPEENNNADAVASDEDDSNTFDFIWRNLWSSKRTIIILKNDSLVISKYRFDDKTKIQVEIGTPITISYSAIAFVKKGRAFSPITVFGGIGMGILVGFFGIGGLITVLIFTILSLFMAFPRKLVIKRKDGTKFSTRLDGRIENRKNYERFMNVIYQ